MKIEIENGKINVYELGTDCNDLFTINCIADLLFYMENFYSEKYRYPHDMEELYKYISIGTLNNEEPLPFN